MFEFDICLCGNKDECPQKDTCLRAQPVPPGIYTYSLLYNGGSNCRDYIEIKRKDVDKND